MTPARLFYSYEHQGAGKSSYLPGTFGYERDFLFRYHPDLVELSDEDGQAAALIVPAYQGRIMTSTLGGPSRPGFGWINHSLIAAPGKDLHMNAVGGEDRFWLGPEGGQFSIFFAPGKPFQFENWFVPAPIDTEPFEMLSAGRNFVQFQKHMHMRNYSNTEFKIRINRDIKLLSRQEVGSMLEIPMPASVQTVAFQSENSMRNTGSSQWTKDQGLLSIWILGMFNASDHSTVVIPFDSRGGKLATAVTDDYFGKVPADRLRTENGFCPFKADGRYRSKVGIGPDYALPVAGSFDTTANVLTIVQFSFEKGRKEYVNSLWKLQEDPFSGDVVNAYNDGPLDGIQMGRFYELESSSPAASLAPGESITHVHRTIHLSADSKQLDDIAYQVFGTGTAAMAL
jgi:hypothetical protein